MKFPVLVSTLVFLIIVTLVSCTQKKSENQNEGKETDEIEKTEQIETTGTESTDLEEQPVKINAKASLDTLLGRWLRTDGNYVIQINSFKEDKKIDAQYFNPNPINIARAEVIPDDNLRIFIEFDDRGYEGSSYDLIYDPQNDALIGKYFQATYSQTYQIGFVRLEE
jgi:hypothetical protein